LPTLSPSLLLILLLLSKAGPFFISHSFRRQDRCRFPSLLHNWFALGVTLIGSPPSITEYPGRATTASRDDQDRPTHNLLKPAFHLLSSAIS
jgi:hypothetical protein